MQDVRRLTISSLPSLPPSLSLPSPISFVLRPSSPSCLSCFAEAAFHGSTFCLFYFSLHPLSAFTSKLRTARCSETLQLLAGGLASYAVLAPCVLRGNRRQFAPICVWHHFLEIFVVARKPPASSRSSSRPSAEDSRQGFFRSRQRILVISFGTSLTYITLFHKTSSVYANVHR